MVKVISISICLLFINFNAMALESCAKETSNGGVTSANLIVKFTSADSNANWRVIASAAQEKIGNNAAYDTENGIYLTFKATTFGFASPMPPLFVQFSGNESIEKAILNTRGIDSGQKDPNPCDPDKDNDSDDEEDLGGGSGGGGGDGGGGGGYCNLACDGTGGGGDGGGGSIICTVQCEIIIKRVT